MGWNDGILECLGIKWGKSQVPLMLIKPGNGPIGKRDITTWPPTKKNLEGNGKWNLNLGSTPTDMDIPTDGTYSNRLVNLGEIVVEDWIIMIIK